MRTLAISNADMMEIQLRKWMARGRVHNVTLKPAYSHPSVPPGETIVAEVIARGGHGVFFTSNGFTLPVRGFIPYGEIVSAAWISTRPDRFARKREDFDHIEFSLRDGSSVTLTDVEQAVFPLLRFFQWMIGNRKQSD